MKTKRWLELKQTVGCLVRKGESESELLVGLKRYGVIAGKLAAPGGHILPNEHDWVSCRREVGEESNLSPIGGRRVAELIIRIEGKSRIITVQVYLFKEWSGRLINKTNEYYWLKFIPLSEIIDGNVPPGDEKWLHKVLIEHQRKKVYIRCGKDRNDLLSIRMYDLI